MFNATVVEGFANACLVRKYDQATAIPDFHRELWNLCCSEKRYIAIAAPRRHAKSTSITLCWTLAAILFRKHRYVLIVSDTEAQSTLFLSDIKQELMENEDIIKLFGVKRFLKLAETDIIVEMNDGYKFRVSAKGAEQKLRGTKWDHHRPDLILCDDLENEEITASQDRREKFRRWFSGALLPAISSTGKVIIVGTILHMDSLLERLMPQIGGKFTVDEDLKTYSTNNHSMWKAVKYRAHTPDFKKVLWPDQWDAAKLKELKKEFVDQGMPDVYAREYLNYPIDESFAYFKRDDLLGLRSEDVDKENFIYYSAVDFAVATSERSDWTVIATVAINTNGTLLVVDIRRGRWDSFEIIQEMFSVQNRYQPELFIVEQGAIEKSIGPFLRKEMLTRNKYLNLYPKVPTKDKLSRARSLQARLRAGGVRFDKDASWYQTLEDEMVRFPKDRHDDQVDALSWVGLVLDELQEAPTHKELAEEEYQESLQTYTEGQGRSIITGY